MKQAKEIRLNLNTRQICDLELIINGGFSPLEGFLDEENYTSVINTMRLKNGTVWPIPVVLDVFDKKNYLVGEKLTLCDEYGKPLAYITITSIYEPNKLIEAKRVYGTNDINHFGIGQLFNRVGKYYIGGNIKKINSVDRYDFQEFRHSPRELKKLFNKLGWDKIIGFQTRNPLHKAHFAMIQQAANQYNAKILLHPSVGMTKTDDVDYITRTKCYIMIYEKYMKEFAFLSLLPLAMRMAGPREALLHAIIRKNYGCTHFIIGRDHASPGKDSFDKPFYKPYAAQELVKTYAKEIGIEPILFSEMVYVKNKKTYMSMDNVKKGQSIRNISGTEFRSMIADNKKIPDWFSFPEVINEIRKGAKKQKKEGLTIFFTGLPCSGKSTLARHLYFRLLEIQDKNVTLLDGDVIRQNLSKGLGFTKEDRNINIERIGFVANEITKHKGIAICAAIAPFEESRKKNRLMVCENGYYVEVFVETPAIVCKKRDVKGLYKMANDGKLKGMTGVDDVYEEPSHPEITIDTENRTPNDCIDEIIKYLIEKNILQINL